MFVTTHGMRSPWRTRLHMMPAQFLHGLVWFFQELIWDGELWRVDFQWRRAILWSCSETPPLPTACLWRKCRHTTNKTSVWGCCSVDCMLIPIAALVRYCSQMISVGMQLTYRVCLFFIVERYIAHSALQTKGISSLWILTVSAWFSFGPFSSVWNTASAQVCDNCWLVICFTLCRHVCHLHFTT
jgi:hypothetical protein